MPVFLVIVKGSLPEATMRALKDDLRIRDSQPMGGCTRGLVETTHDVISRWFCEQPSDPPFPPGTLLHYREIQPPKTRICQHCGAVVHPQTLCDVGGRPEFEVCPLCSRTAEGYFVIGCAP